MKQTLCDRCGRDATCSASFSSTVTTPISMDLCDVCLGDIKKVFRAFTRQEVKDLDVAVAEVEKGNPK